MHGERQLYLKPDTALLVNRKPFFLPHFTEDVLAHPCIVARIDRMGRCIAAKFASRYYNETALAINFSAAALEEAKSVDEITKSIAFDNSFSVGVFSTDNKEAAKWWQNGITHSFTSMLTKIDEAIALASSYITLRTGDMVAVDLLADPISAKREDVFSATLEDNEILYCKIK